ncbi:MAG TPA: PAS domain-containing sensor histidine kinase [Chitinophagaceae bacterium]|jgi:PAS domain S-box-containing protein|nr:PAS domain-containing sensor histidine kinase [Chitinophagaceae bacterium]
MERPSIRLGKLVQQKEISPQENDFRSKYLELLKKIAALQTGKIQCEHLYNEIENIYNSSPCGHHSTDNEGVITRMNDTELEWLGYKKDELCGTMKITDLLNKTDRARYFKDSRNLSKGSHVRHSYKLFRKDKSFIPVVMDLIGIFDENGELTASQATVFNPALQQAMGHHPSTSRAKLESKNMELNKAHEKMMLLNEAKDRFIGIAYHDLQSPLAVIMLLTKILLGSNLPESSVKQKETYHTIYDASLQMNELIKNYLNVNRIEKGLIVPSLVPVDIVKLIKNIILRYEEIAQRKEIPILFTGTQKNVIITDGECFLQIVENLLSNAIKFTPRGKSVFIKASNKGPEVVVEVEDEGVGILQEEIPMLYEKFQHLSSKPTDGELSTGLGLSIVKFLVDQLKGTISVKSKIGKGTRFSVRFRRDGKAVQDKTSVKKTTRKA